VSLPDISWYFLHHACFVEDAGDELAENWMSRYLEEVLKTLGTEHHMDFWNESPSTYFRTGFACQTEAA
jgi:hypothetical protein